MILPDKLIEKQLRAVKAVFCNPDLAAMRKGQERLGKIGVAAQKGAATFVKEPFGRFCAVLITPTAGVSNSSVAALYLPGGGYVSGGGEICCFYCGVRTHVSGMEKLPQTMRSFPSTVPARLSWGSSSIPSPASQGLKSRRKPQKVTSA